MRRAALWLGVVGADGVIFGGVWIMGGGILSNPHAFGDRDELASYGERLSSPPRWVEPAGVVIFVIGIALVAVGWQMIRRSPVETATQLTMHAPWRPVVASLVLAAISSLVSVTALGWHGNVGAWLGVGAICVVTLGWMLRSVLR